MYHGVAHIAYDQQNGPRGDNKLISSNWAMLMAQRNIGQRNQLSLSAMLSLEPLTIGGSGYPLIFQTGETWNGDPLKDHQHPHNFFSELSAKYTHAFNRDIAGFIYLAPVGEPALGPVAFPHRVYAMDNPLSPLGHHWQDSTHIAYGVVTLGCQTREWQIEASTFNGREPGENRYAIESPLFDSFSTRLSYNPSSDLSGQISYGFLKSPEPLHPGEDVHRTTASVIYNRPINENKNLYTALVWGRNSLSGHDLNSYLLDVDLKHDEGWSLYGRYEWVSKDAEELVLPDSFPEDQVFPLNQLTLGICRDIPSESDFQWGVGLQVNVSIVPDELKAVYGDNPTGWLLYMRVHPKRMSHNMAIDNANASHPGH